MPIVIRQRYEEFVARHPNRMRFEWFELPRARIACRMLSAKLEGLGVTDLSKEGSLPLSGRIVLRPGLRRGVQGYTPPPSGPLDYNSPPLNTLLDTGRRLVTSSSANLVVDEVCLVANEYTFYSDVVFVIGADIRNIIIVANKIIAMPGAKISWEITPIPDRGPSGGRGTDGNSYNPHVEVEGVADFRSPSGGNGGVGPSGLGGLDGTPGPKVEIWCLEANGLPSIDLKGQQGGRGGPGCPGGSGGNGAKGLHSASNAFNCTRGPGYGGNGGAGGAGGAGGVGGAGGDGGSLSLYTVEATHDSLLSRGLIIDLSAGSGGAGGIGGQGGPGGGGGSQGSREGWCSRAFGAHERDGSNGAVGAVGAVGQPGDSGSTGRFKAIVIAESDFVTLLNEPLIEKITSANGTSCYQPFIGDSIQIHGRNFASTDSVRLDALMLSSQFSSDKLLVASLAGVPSGQHKLVVVEPGGAHTSNEVELGIRPTIREVSPRVCSLGDELTIRGQGFQQGATLLFNRLEIPTKFISAAELKVTLPTPAAPYEELGGPTLIIVRNPDSLETGSTQLTVRHVIDTGFDPQIHGFDFINSPTGGVASLSTLTETFGAAEYAAEAIDNPVLLAAFTAFYLWFFNTRQPGYSSGFSMLAAQEYWNGNNQLRQLYPNLDSAARSLTVAMGHILGAQILRKLHAQSMDGRNRIYKTLQEIEQAFRTQINARPAERAALAPILQTIPSGGIFSSTFYENIATSHGLLPIRIEYPVAGEAFDARICVYENRGIHQHPQGREKMWIEVWTANGQPECKLIRNAVTGEPEYPSSAGWTISCLSLQEAYLDDVSMPLDLSDFVIP